MPKVAGRSRGVGPPGGDRRIQTRLREARLERGLSQGELAQAAGLTRQAVYSIESRRYLPNVSIALRLAHSLGRRVEDLFSFEASGATVEGDLLGVGRRPLSAARAKVWSVGDRTLVLPVSSLGADLAYSTPADGLIVGPVGRAGRVRRVRVQLFQDARAVGQQIVVAGCDPAIQLVAERLRQHRDPAFILVWPMGSTAAVEALERKEVHVAGLHVVDPHTGESNLPFVRQHLRGTPVTLVTFASWEAGLLTKSGNPRSIKGPSDLARKDVRLVNRETGSGARLLLDQSLRRAGIKSAAVRGYSDVVSSHFEVGRRIAEGTADVGVGVESIARLLGLEFLPLRTERFDLAIPSGLLTAHPGLARLLEALVSQDVQAEIAALGGYSTRETGRIVTQPETKARPARRH
ncbi:MAG TPA: substrate-binding domain-containing protein [Vicinamibacteria bacterium]|nr:substrate-binding domain-containing protein [Vicinamibacteria bacterium]